MASTLCRRWWFDQVENSVFVYRDVKSAGGGTHEIKNLVLKVSEPIVNPNNEVEVRHV